MALFQDFPEIALNMHESKAPPMGQSHVTKSELMPHPLPERGEVGLNIDRRIIFKYTSLYYFFMATKVTGSTKSDFFTNFKKS